MNTYAFPKKYKNKTTNRPLVPLKKTPSKDISYKYLPRSVFDVAKVGKHGIRGKQCWSLGYKSSITKTYSPFPPDVAEWCAKYFLRDKYRIFDPFAGWGERGRAVRDAGKDYIGFDISYEAINYAKDVFDVDIHYADSAVATIPSHNGLLTCPPYWNVEKYDNVNGLDKAPTWDNFLQDYENIWRNVTRVADCGSKYCIIVGDWRRKHIFYDLVHQTERILMKCGFRIFDKVILNYKKITPIVAIPNCKLHGYTSKVHQYLLVFEKPFLPCVQRILRSRRKKLLELFSGTGSVRKVATRMGYDVLSLDLSDANLNIDILQWNYKALPIGLFDVIWASPPCHTFSRMRTSWIGRRMREFGDRLVTQKLLNKSMYENGLPLLIRTEEIIDYFKPNYYFIENPKGGKMKDFCYRPYVDVSYCRYGYDYRKDTRIWTNLHFYGKTCNCFLPHARNVAHVSSLRERYSIPLRLIKELLTDRKSVV